MYRTLYSHLASKVRYISHLGHTPNIAEPLVFKQGAVYFSPRPGAGMHTYRAKKWKCSQQNWLVAEICGMQKYEKKFNPSVVAEK